MIMKINNFDIFKQIMGFFKELLPRRRQPDGKCYYHPSSTSIIQQHESRRQTLQSTNTLPGMKMKPIRALLTSLV